MGLADWLEAYVAQDIRARSRGIATLRQPRRVVLHHQPPAGPDAAVPRYAQAPVAVAEAEGRGGRRALTSLIDAAACLHGSCCIVPIPRGAHQMTRFHDTPRQGCQTATNSDTVKPNVARPGSLLRRVE